MPDISDLENAWLLGSAQFDEFITQDEMEFMKPYIEMTIMAALMQMPPESLELVDPVIKDMVGFDKKMEIMNKERSGNQTWMNVLEVNNGLQ